MTYSRPLPFRLPPAKARAVRRSVNAQEAIVASTMAKAVGAMELIAAQVFNRLLAGAPYADPRMAELDAVMEGFLRITVTTALRVGDHNYHADTGRTTARLARLPRGRLPDVQSLRELYRNTAAWQGMERRNRLYTNRLKAAYARKLRQYFARLVPRVTSGELTPAEAQAQLQRTVRSTAPRVKTIFRTETTKYFAEAQRAYFDDEPGIIGYLFDSVGDTARTEICRSRHGMVIPMGSKSLLDKNTPPLHWNCRSHLIPMADTPSNRKLLADASRMPGNRRLAPLPPGWAA